MRALVAGYYGFGNLGDELILSALLKELKSVYPGSTTVVLSHRPAFTSQMHKTKAISRWNPFGVLWQMFRSDLFVLGGGGLLQDKTSFRSLFYYLSLVALARLSFKYVLLYKIGVETIEKASSKWLLQFLLTGSRVKITVRDPQSLKKLISLGFTSEHIQILRDPVFDLNLSVPPRIHNQDLKKILFIPRFPVLPKTLALYNDVRFLFESRLGVAIDEVIFEPRTEKKFRPNALSIELLEPLKDLLASCDLVVSARYHGLVLAILANRPFIGIGDPQKTGRLCESMKMPHLGWEASRREVEEALGRITSASSRRDFLESSFGFVDKVF